MRGTRIIIPLAAAGLVAGPLWAASAAQVAEPAEPAGRNAAEAAAMRSSSVALSVSDNTPDVGDRVKFTAKLRPQAKRKVLLQWKPAGSWRTVAMLRSDSSGKATYKWKADTQGTFKFRAKAPADSMYAGATSSAEKVKVTGESSSVSVTGPTDKVLIGGDSNAVPVEVMVDPGVSRRIEIQARNTNDKWHAVATMRTDSSGKAKGTWPAYTAGDYQVRAVAQATRSLASATSKPVDVEIGFGPVVPTYTLDPMAPKGLSVAKKAYGNYKIGAYKVKIAKNNGKPRLKVVDNKGRTAWVNDPGAAFVSASLNELEFFDRADAAQFWPQIFRSARLAKQSVKTVKKSGSGIAVKGKVSGGGEKAAYTMTLKQVKRGGVKSVEMDLKVAKTASGNKVNSVQVTSGRKSGTGIHGFGEQFQDFDLSGQVLPVLVVENGVTRGEEPQAKIIDLATWGAGNLQTTYGAWPTYVTGQNRSFEVVDNLQGGSFSVANMTNGTQISLEAFDTGIKARVVARGNPRDLMAARGAGIDRPELVDWVQRGSILGLQGGTDKVRKVVKDMQQAGTKISAVWLQDWLGKRVTKFGEQLWWTWQLDRTTYPGWDQMVKDFNNEGIQVLTYINPFVIDVDTVNGNRVANYYTEGAKKGYLVKNQRGNPYVVELIGFPAAMVDLTNPKARDWYADIIADNVLGAGATGFMADFGEAIPFDAVLHKGSALEQHNRYPELWAETVREGCERGGVPDCMVFFRSSYLGTPKYAPLMWAGDQMVNFAVEDGMMSAVKGMLAGGVSGHPLWHSDIGGYTSLDYLGFVRPSQLNARWAEMQAFGPVMRTHESNKPRQNQQVYDTPETRAQFARATQIYAALYDYRKGVVDEGVDKGVPAMRHAWLVYPGSLAAGQDLQFFLGSHLYMAPVYTEGATTVDVTFPPGKWQHILTGQVFDGDRVTTVQSPIGTPAAFVKVGDPVGEQIIAAMKKAGLHQ